MPRSAFAPLLGLWSSACLGCVLFLGLGLVPGSPPSLALLGELAWLATVGSVPTTLVLGAAAGGSRSPRAAVSAVAIAIAVLGLAVSWQHTDFLLSGPRWAAHPHRGAWRIALGTAFGLAGALGWLWLVVGNSVALDAKGMQAGIVPLNSFVGGMGKAFLVGVEGSTKAV